MAKHYQLNPYKSDIMKCCFVMTFNDTFHSFFLCVYVIYDDNQQQKNKDDNKLADAYVTKQSWCKIEK
jgi:hypothetical protein